MTINVQQRIYTILFVFTVFYMIIFSPPHQAFAASTVDLTDFYTGAVASHECSKYLKTAYDSNNHWKECIICGKRYDTHPHTITTMGTDACHWSNPGQTRICNDCGYKTIYKRPHRFTNKLISHPGHHGHFRQCLDCGDDIGADTGIERCTDSRGNVIGCSGGTCAKCGYHYGASHNSWCSSSGTSGATYCATCGVMLIKYDNNTGYWINDNSKYISIRITDWNRSVFGNNINTLMNSLHMVTGNAAPCGNISNFKKYVSNGCIYASCTVTFPYQNYTTTYCCNLWQFDTYVTRVWAWEGQGPIERKAPTILDTSMSYPSRYGDYSTKATLTVTCTDNWNYDPNYVEIRTVDKNKNPVSDWVTCKRSGSTYTQNIDLTAEAKGTQAFYVQVRDAGGNVSEKQIELVNLDSRAPVVTSVMTTSKDWTKSKSVTFTCTDEGSGDVEIAFNDQSDYKKATYSDGVYSRTYTFTGEVYGNVKAAVYFKDGTGNITTAFVNVYNLDNTDPVITITSVSDVFNTSKEAIGWKIDIAGNDYNSELKKDGSGIVGYALTKTTQAPEDSDYNSIPSFSINHSGSYYVWVKDAAGNVARTDKPVKIHSDVFYNGKNITSITGNEKSPDYIYYRGKRFRL